MLKYAFIAILFVGSWGPLNAQNTDTKLVLLGTGTPFADPNKSGPSLAIVVNNTSYIVDCGPGVVRRAAEASKLGFPSLEASQLKTLFITSLLFGFILITIFYAISAKLQFIYFDIKK